MNYGYIIYTFFKKGKQNMHIYPMFFCRRKCV